MNLESTGLIKGFNIFGSKMGKYLQHCERKNYCATRKNFESRTQLDEPVEGASGGDPLLLYNILHLLFSLWYEFFVQNPFRDEKIWNFRLIGR